jgi:hypothetical protein
MATSKNQQDPQQRVDQEAEGRKPFAPPDLSREDELTSVTGERMFTFSSSGS